MVMFHSFVSLPEGISYVVYVIPLELIRRIMIQIWILINYQNIHVVNYDAIQWHIIYINTIFCENDIYIYNHPEVDRISGISKKNGPKKTYR